MLIYYQKGNEESEKTMGNRLDSALTITQLLDHWESTGKVEKSLLEATREFLKQSK